MLPCLVFELGWLSRFVLAKLGRRRFKLAVDMIWPRLLWWWEMRGKLPAELWRVRESQSDA